jgi:predicted nucleotidyltransferase
MTSARVDLPYDRLDEFCRRWKVTELALFGSVLRDDFRADSDVDVLVSFEPNAGWTLLDHVEMQEQLQGIFGRPVDLVSRRAIEGSPNWIRRREILGTAQPIYVAG